MSKLLALFNVFRRGCEVADPAAWKRGQVTANTIVGALSALVVAGNAFGYSLPVADDQLTALAGGLFALVNIGITVASTSKIGLPPMAEDAGTAPAPDDLSGRPGD